MQCDLISKHPEAYDHAVIYMMWCMHFLHILLLIVRMQLNVFAYLYLTLFGENLII